MSYVCILGRQPALGLAELESRFGSHAVKIIQPDIAGLGIDKDSAFSPDHLGGTLKLARVLARLDFTDWDKLANYLERNLPKHLEYIPEGKITIGISAHGLKTNPARLNATALSLKKVIKKSGRAARVVPNKELTLNTAQVLHNKLAGPNGLELVLIQDGTGTLLAQTAWVQDIEAYRRRDQERPMRDARVGMLPPKLAQIIINLAGPKIPGTLLDPFCGTGVILQEALLMSIQAAGSDLEPRMVEYTQKNLEWLNKQTELEGTLKDLEAADATSHKWKTPFNTIAAETFLGRPLSSPPDQETLNKIVQDCNTIHKKFLQNIARQTEPGFRMCIAVPAWRVKNGFKRLPTLDHLEELGYNQVKFEHVHSSDLIYHRDGQIVGRELVVLSRK